MFKIRRPEDTHTFVFNQSELVGGYKEFLDKYMEIDLDSLINMIGTQGRYHYILILLMSIMAITSATILYSSSFLFADPNFTCKDAAGNSYSCKEAVFCKLYICSQRLHL